MNTHIYQLIVSQIFCSPLKFIFISLVLIYCTASVGAHTRYTLDKSFIPLYLYVYIIYNDLYKCFKSNLAYVFILYTPWHLSIPKINTERNVGNINLILTIISI